MSSTFKIWVNPKKNFLKKSWINKPLTKQTIAFEYKLYPFNIGKKTNNSSINILKNNNKQSSPKNKKTKYSFLFKTLKCDT